MKLYYFDIYGRAEPIRLLLDHAKVPFEDIRLTRPQFQELKEQGLFEFGQVPVLELNGKRYSQSISILRMLGRKYGYYPEEDDLDLAWKIDSNLDANVDFQEKYWHVHIAKDEDQKKLLQDYQTKDLPNYLNFLEKRLLANVSQKYIAGEKITIADFDNAHIAFDYFLNPKNKYHKEQEQCLDNYKSLRKYYEGLREEMKEHFDARPADKPF